MRIVTKKGVSVEARLSNLSLRVILTAMAGGELLDAEIPCSHDGEITTILASAVDIRQTFEGERSTYSLVNIKKGDD